MSRSSLSFFYSEWVRLYPANGLRAGVEHPLSSLLLNIFSFLHHRWIFTASLLLPGYGVSSRAFVGGSSPLPTISNSQLPRKSHF